MTAEVLPAVGLTPLAVDVITALKEEAEPLNHGVPNHLQPGVLGPGGGGDVTNIQDITSEGQELPESYVNILSQMQTLAEECNNLSKGFDDWIVANEDQFVKDLPQETDSDIKALMRIRVASDVEWCTTRRLYYAVDEHLRNAMEYHKIHQELEGLQTELLRLSTRIQVFLRKASDGSHKATSGGLRRLGDSKAEDGEGRKKHPPHRILRDLGGIFSSFLLYNAAVGVTVAKSKQILPVGKRVKRNKKPLSAISLCAYRLGNVDVTEGEEIQILDNTDNDNWKIQTQNGITLHVPAVTVLIPPPDKKVVIMAESLQIAIKNLWLEYDQILRKILVKKTIQLYEKYTDDESNFEVVLDKKQSELLSVLERTQHVTSVYLSNVDNSGKLMGQLVECKRLVQDSSQQGEEDKNLKHFHRRILPTHAEYSQYKALRILFGLDPKDEKERKRSTYELKMSKGNAIVTITSTDVTAARQGSVAQDKLNNDISALTNADDNHETEKDGDGTQEALMNGDHDDERAKLEPDMILPEKQRQLGAAPTIIEPDPEPNNDELEPKDSPPSPISSSGPSSLGLGVNVSRGTGAHAETSSMTEAKGEIIQVMKITGVVDSGSSRRMSLADAQEIGILDFAKNAFRDTRAKSIITIDEAIQENLIQVESRQVKKTHEVKKTIGFLKIITTKESRPFTITRILEPNTKCLLSVEEAVSEGVFLPDQCIYVDHKQGLRYNLMDAIQQGLIIGEDDEDEGVKDTQETTYIVMSVSDAATGAKLTLDEAIDRSILLEASAEYVDTANNRRMMLDEAIRRGLVDAKAATDKQLEAIQKPDRRISSIMAPNPSALNTP